MRFARLLLTLLSLTAVACQGLINDANDLPGGDDDEWDGDSDPLGCNVFTSLARSGCTASGCHGARYQGGLDLFSPGLGDRLLGVRSTTQACRDQFLVDPTNISGSVFLQAIDWTIAGTDASCAAPMPYQVGEDTLPEMSAEDKACVTTWVQALIDANPPPPALTFEPAAPETYVAKVKNLLTGEALTADDLAQVKSDATNLRDLVTDWVNSPRFLVKLRGFFATTLQPAPQVAVTEYFTPLTRAARNAKLQASMTDSLLSTAVGLVEEGAPFTEIATTRRWWMNTALLTATMFFEQTVAERAALHTVETGTTALPLATSISQRRWIYPDARADCTVISPTRFNEGRVLSAFFGYLDMSCPERVGTTLVPLVTGPVLQPTDFTDWRWVELVPATTATTTPWYDLVRMRGATRAAVRNPRPGFFSTLSFQLNWLTNEDNSYRVTLNQTLIAALDATFSQSDSTAPYLPDQVDAVHAAPTSACYGCHKLMDPMRGYFSSKTDTVYAYKDNATPAGFAFLGKRVRGATRDDFASAIATHPRFAMAWTQKLCMYAMSRRCDERDPEVQRIATAFANDNFDFKTLVIELLSSPLVTETSEVATFAIQAPFVSISRRDHLCATLRARGGMTNICEIGAVANALKLVAGDAYARGQTDLVQSVTSTPFHMAATNRLCMAVGPQVVGGSASKYPAAATDLTTRIVNDFMGLPEGHSRRVATIAALDAHIAAARTGGATAVDAARSAFIAACSTTDLLGMGL